jgi:hypothetical protein
MIGFSAGGTAFTDFQRGEARSGGRDFDRRLSAQPTIAIAGTFTYWVSSGLGFRAHASYAPSRFVIEQPDEASAAESVGTEARPLAPLTVLIADLSVIFRAPVAFGRVVPYGIAGAGVIDYRADPGQSSPLPAEAREAFANDNLRRFAGVLGVGAVIPLQQRDFFLTVELTDHFTRSPVADAAVGPFEVASDMVIDPDGHGSGDTAGLTNTFRVLVGVTIPL